MIQIDEMVAFVTVVELGSFTESARRLTTTKSVISRRVRDLERSLGVLLLDREAQGARPSEVGAAYYAKCVHILESIQAASDFAAGFNNLVKGKLRVAIPRSFEDEFIMPLLNRFALEHPKVLLDIEPECDIRPVKQHFDVAIRAGKLASSDLVARQLVTFPFVMCASPEYLKRQGTPVAPDDLQGHNVLVNSSGEHDDAWRYRHERGWRPYRFRERMRSSNCRQLIDAACAGLGIVMMPRPLVGGQIAAGRLQILLPRCETPDGMLSMVYPRSGRASQKVQKLLDFLTQSASSFLDHCDTALWCPKPRCDVFESRECGSCTTGGSC